LDDGKCYLCRKCYYDASGECPGCGTYEPGFRPRPAEQVNVEFTITKDGVKGGELYGYHAREIKKGELGKASKITEEYEEFLDAKEQDNPVMELVELSDLLGAIEAYTKRKYNLDLGDLMAMTRATQRAFQNGHRK
jgi:hypothetical protein